MRATQSILLIVVMLALIEGPAGAQQSKKIPRIGILTVGTAPSIGAFLQGLHELGWVEGQNIAIVYRSADGNEKRLSVVASQLVQANVDIIVSTSSRGTLAARQVTGTIPVVATSFEGRRLIDLHRPEGNITGVSHMPQELGGKRLELLKEIISEISRVAILANMVDPTQVKPIKEIDAIARSLSVQIQILNVKKPDEIENAFASMVREKADALSVLTSSMFTLNRAEIVKRARKSRLPAIYPIADLRTLVASYPMGRTMPSCTAGQLIS